MLALPSQAAIVFCEPAYKKKAQNKNCFYTFQLENKEEKILENGRVLFEMHKKVLANELNYIETEKQLASLNPDDMDIANYATSLDSIVEKKIQEYLALQEQISRVKKYLVEEERLYSSVYFPPKEEK